MRMRRVLIALLVAVRAQTQEVEVLVGGEAERNGVLGDVRHVLVLARQLVVLERQPPFLHVFSTTGRRVQTLGRSGGGPGEFRAPYSLAVDPTDTSLVVFDPAGARLTRYRITDTLALLRTERLPSPNVRYGCLAGDRLLTPTEDTALVREFRRANDAWTLDRSWGRKTTAHPLAQHPLMWSRLGFGPMACTVALDTVVLASSDVGELLVGTRRDARTLVASLPRAVPVVVSAEGRGLRLSQPERGWYEHVRAVALGPDGIRLVLERAGQKAEVAGSAFRVLARAPDGTWRRDEAREWFAGGATGGSVYCVQSVPVPAIGRVVRGECP